MLNLHVVRFACAALLAAGFGIAPLAAAPPNIVFILADDLAWSDVGFNGAEFFETPNIDRLASQGMIFSQAYAGGPNCAPTRACLISGTYTPRHHIYTPGGRSKGDPRRMKLITPTLPSGFERAGIAPWAPNFPSLRADSTSAGDEGLDPSFVSLAELLEPAGYATGRFGKWHLGADDQGFGYSTLGAIDNGKGGYYDDPEATQRLTTAAIGFMKQHRERPFFLYLPYWDVHTPLVATQDLVEKYEAKLKRVRPERPYKPVYAAMIEAVDTGVGRVLRALEELGLENNTLVIFSSDNGGIEGNSFNAPLRGGKGSLYEGGIRVATCMRWPGVVKPGSETATPITSVDFRPTFAELSGAKLPASQPIDGASFVPLLKGERALEDRAIYWHYPHYLDGNGPTNYMPLAGGTVGQGQGWRMTPASAIREGDWKLIEFFEDGHVELYDIPRDIGEKNDLAAAKPEIARRLHEKLKAWQKQVSAPVPSERNPHYDISSRDRPRSGR